MAGERPHPACPEDMPLVAATCRPSASCPWVGAEALASVAPHLRGLAEFGRLQKRHP